MALEKQKFNVDVTIAGKVVAVITMNAFTKEQAEISAQASIKCKASKSYEKDSKTKK